MLKFEQLPHIAKQAAMAAYGYRNSRHRYGAEYRRFGAFLEASRSWGQDRQLGWQAAELARRVAAAAAGSRHYAAAFAGIEAKPADDPGALLAALPLLEKKVLREGPEGIVDRNVPSFSNTVTSGSTGSPMVVEHDRDSLQRLFALLADQQSWAGVGFKSRSVRLSGRILVRNDRPSRRPWLYNPAERQLFVSSYHLDEAHRPLLNAKLRRYQPEAIDGYPTAILSLLRLCEPAALRSLKLIVTTAETLHPELRAGLVEHGGVPILDYYGASEGLPLIQQCPAGTYHVRWQSGIVEVIPSGGDSADGEGHGELVCTSFVQDRTPLIRYRTGDLARGYQPHFECRCGLATPVVGAILGRLEDLVRTRDGRALGMFTYRTLKQIGGLEESQVIQEDYERFTLNVVLKKGADPAVVREEITDRFERVLGSRPRVELVMMDKLPLGPSGKVRLVRSMVKSPAR